MDLREGEKILKVYHHHPTPFAFKFIKIALSMVPFYIFLFLIDSSMDPGTYIFIHIVLAVIFLLLVSYISLVYWLDKLIITNMRVVFIDYKYLTTKEDSFVDISDIQDIKTRENGVLSYFWIFDYGSFEIETSSSTISIIFPNSPCPETIRQFLFHLKNP